MNAFRASEGVRNRMPDRGWQEKSDETGGGVFRGFETRRVGLTDCAGCTFSTEFSVSSTDSIGNGTLVFGCLDDRFLGSFVACL